jgi:hypothetical protein
MLSFRCRSTGCSRRLGLPSRDHRVDPAGVLRGSGDPHGVSCPYSDVGEKIHQPGIPAPVRSVFSVSHALDGLLPSRFPTTRIGAAHGVHPSEPFPSAEPYASRRLCPPAVSVITSSCSEDQEVMVTRDSRALLPAEIRTVPGRSPFWPMLSWDSRPREELVRTTRTRLPGPDRIAVRRLRPKVPPSLALRPSRSPPEIPCGKSELRRRSSTRTCPRVPPTTAVPCRINPTGSEKTEAAGPVVPKNHRPFSPRSEEPRTEDIRPRRAIPRRIVDPMAPLTEDIRPRRAFRRRFAEPLEPLPDDAGSRRTFRRRVADPLEPLTEDIRSRRTFRRRVADPVEPFPGGFRPRRVIHRRFADPVGTRT